MVALSVGWPVDGALTKPTETISSAPRLNIDIRPACCCIDVDTNSQGAMRSEQGFRLIIITRVTRIEKFFYARQSFLTWGAWWYG